MALSMLIKHLATKAGKGEFDEYVKKILGWSHDLVIERRAVELINDTDITLYQTISTCAYGNFTDAPDGIIKPRSVEVYGTRTGITGSHVGFQVYTTEIDGCGMQVGIGMQYGTWISIANSNLIGVLWHLLSPNSVVVCLAPNGADLKEKKYWSKAGGSVTLEGYHLTGHWSDTVLEFTLSKPNN